MLQATSGGRRTVAGLAPPQPHAARQGACHGLRTAAAPWDRRREPLPVVTAATSVGIDHARTSCPAPAPSYPEGDHVTSSADPHGRVQRRALGGADGTGPPGDCEA